MGGIVSDAPTVSRLDGEQTIDTYVLHDGTSSVVCQSGIRPSAGLARRILHVLSSGHSRIARRSTQIATPQVTIVATVTLAIALVLNELRVASIAWHTSCTMYHAST